MGWRTFSQRGFIAVMFSHDKFNSISYVSSLEKISIPKAAVKMSEGWALQQFNVIIHVSKITISFLSAQSVTVYKYSSFSHDLSTIENL